MATFQDLWFRYGHDRRPANIGAVINGVRIGDIDDEIQDVAGSFAGLRTDIDPVRVARLGLALETLTLLLPSLEPPETRAYFERLAQLGRAVLAEIANREA
jgi:hypothetical protein